MTRPTVLVVDDEAFFRRLFSDILAEEGSYQIEVAESGEEALARLARGGVDILITDMVMPGICGLDLVRRARALDNPPEVILATGNATVESAIQALKNGARDYLLKPCNPEQLRHLIRTCLEQRRLLDENSLLRSQIRLYQQGQQLSSQLDVDNLLQEALQLLRHETGAPSRGLAFFAGPDGVSRIVGGSDGDLGEEPAKSLADALFPHINTIGKGELLDASRLALAEGGPDDIRQLWLFPLQADSGVLGTLVLFNPEGQSFPAPFPHDRLLFLAEQAALGFRNACQYQGARELIYTDDLTGLYNHRYLQIALEQEIRRAERYGLDFSLAFIDLDLFKSINDTHGHLIGSSVLREVGEQLRRCVRDADMLFRYGGDEFTALLVETDNRGAKVVAERIRRTIEEHVYDAGQGKTCRLTATVGHATYPVHARTKQELIDLADRAMYEGKQSRNVIRGAAELKPG
ncbi:MAG: diguanylate cyclase [Deltaproteobacteria bacterium]|nr:MAG: diguanylate cyclase [Deltaproteobacteria bacterium]